ncbi:MAG TPA: autotransporter-associated beta strand repeat-containing protein [Verrucomicrobiae bacterium]|jgi:autotransporter-associated beta strand protein
MTTQSKHFGQKLLRRAKLILGVTGALAMTYSGIAASLFWVGGGTSASAPASGNWDTTTKDWSSTSTGAPTAAWAAANAAYFGGADGNYAVTVGANFSAQNIVFTNSGYVLSANAPQTITVTASGTGAFPNVLASSGKNGSISNNVTVNVSAATCVLGAVVGNAGSRTLVVDSGGVLSHSGSGSWIAVGNATIRVKTGGYLLAGSTSTSSGATIGGGTAGSDLPIISVEGGIFSNTITGGPFAVGNANSGTLTITNGGLVAMSQNVSKPLQIGGTTANAGKTGTVNLDGGTLIVNQVTNNAAGNTSTFNFNGGILKPNNANNTAIFMMPGLTAANVRNDGAIIDNNGFAVTIGQPLVHSTINGDNVGDGGLISQGSGIVTLTGANSYNGPTVVNSGTLFTTTASIGAGAYSVSNSATLGLTVASAGGSLAVSTLTLGTSTADVLTNTFAIGANSSTATAPLAVSGALTLNGTVTVNVSGSGFSGPNTYPLISYSATSGSGDFVAGTLPTVPGYIASLTNDTSAGKVELLLMPPPPAENWAVGNGVWDATTFNWIPLGGGDATNYSEGAMAAFDDSASGASPITVTLATDHAPSAITNNSTKNYVFAGNQNLNTAQLTKDGSSTLTLDNGSGNFFGSILIKSGIIQIGNDDTGGSLGSGSVTNNGTLQFNRTDSAIFANPISGTGGITQSGTGIVTLSGGNTYTGNTVINAGKLTTTTASKGAGAYSIADNATLEVQVSASGASLTNSSLTLGTSGALTNNFTLGSFASTTIPSVTVSGTLTLNGTVAVNVTGTGLATGTYLLMSYGSISGSGSFMLVSAPSVNGNSVALVNDPVAKQLELAYTPVSALTWDAGNTANGATIDAASGTWDTSPGNIVWNDGAVDRSWANAVPTTFGGADGAWAINLAANVSPSTLAFTNDGYAISATAPQSITLGTGSGASPNLKVDGSKMATIGANVTLQVSGANNLIVAGSSGQGTPAGTLGITTGGTVQVTGNATLGLVGAGTTVSVKAGGMLKRTATGTVLLGSVAGDNCTLSVDGGNVSIMGSGVLRIGGSGTVAVLGGTLTVNSGSFSMDASNTTIPMTLGVNASNLGTNNLNGGTLMVNQIVQGAGNGYINFNGGTLKAVNNALAATFLNGLTTANVRNGGAVIDNNGFDIAIGQALLHSTVIGDSAADGGLTSQGSGSLTLTNANTYTGNTTINAGRLALSGNGSIANSASIIVAGSATFDVSAVTFALGSGQVLSNSTPAAMLIGNIDASAGMISLLYNSGMPSFTITNGMLNLSGSTAFNVNNTGLPLAVGSYKLVAANTAGLVAGALPPVAVGGSGVVAGSVTSLQIINSELYLVVASSQLPVITSIGIHGVTLNLMATNGAQNGTYILLQSTNIALPLSQWTPVLTNSFDSSGSLNLSTNIVTSGATQQFYIISQ